MLQATYHHGGGELHGKLKGAACRWLCTNIYGCWERVRSHTNDIICRLDRYIITTLYRVGDSKLISKLQNWHPGNKLQIDILHIKL